MKNASDLPSVGINDTPMISWIWFGSSSGVNNGWVTTYKTKDVLAFDAGARLVTEMNERGFTLAAESYALITRNEAANGDKDYNAVIDLYFARDRLWLKLPIRLGTMRAASEALARNGEIARGRLIAPVSIVGGRGQKKAVQARARELVDLAQDVLHLVRPRQGVVEWRETRAVYVTYLTRGGKGGRIAKTAGSWFSLDEAAQFAPLPTEIIQAHEERPYDAFLEPDPFARLGR
jgi:hypothetical protein